MEIINDAFNAIILLYNLKTISVSSKNVPRGPQPAECIALKILFARIFPAKPPPTIKKSAKFSSIITCGEIDPGSRINCCNLAVVLLLEKDQKNILVVRFINITIVNA